MSDILTLPLKGEYFDAIRNGEKSEEFRLVTPYWTKRLEGRHYNSIVLKRGYPKNDDHARIMVVPWRGCYRKTVAHPHFGADPVEVYAIDVASRP